MTEHDDTELLARFQQRLAGIEHEIGDPPAWRGGVLRGSTRVVGAGDLSWRGLAELTFVVAVVLVTVLAAIPLLAGRNPSPPSPTTGGLTTEDTPPASASSGSALLSVVAGGNTACLSEGGCATFFGIQPTPGTSVPIVPEWRFGGGPGALRAPAAAPTSLLPGRYRASAHLNWVSDVVMNGQSPTIGGVVSTCQTDFVVDASTVSVRVQITFEGLDPCQITADTVERGVSPSPTPSTSGIATLQRPLHLPTLATGAPCPVTPTTAQPGLTSLPGDGPIYPMTTMVGGTVYYDPASAPNGQGAVVTWVAAPGFRGPVLVRGGRIDGSGELTFGMDQLPELAITTYDVTSPIGPLGWAALESNLTVIPGPGCYAYQLDGPAFSTIVVFAAQPRSALAGVLARRLHLPTLAAGASCPTTTPRTIVDWVGPAIGPGPIYSIGYDPSGALRWAGSSETGGWWYFKIAWLEAPGAGPILVRGGQLDGTNTVGFGGGPVPSAKLVLEASDRVGVSGSIPGWLNYVAYTRVRAPGCYAYQVDTVAGSETITFEAGP